MAGVLAAVLTLGVIAFHLFFRASTTLYVHNDTDKYVTIATCGVDLTPLPPGATVEIYPYANDPNEGCVVYQSDSRDVLGCLYTPTTRLRAGTVIPLSAYIPGVPLNRCVNL